MARIPYSLAWWLATPLIVAYLLWRSRRQPQYRSHWGERWGFAPARVDGRPLVWVHAVSVGETRAALPLVAALLERDASLAILLTHMTPTGRATGEELFASRFAGRVLQAWLPYDYPGATRRFLRAWRPAIGIVMETELWPNLCAAAARERVPLALVNARLSERSLRKGLRWRALTTPALASLARVIAQTEGDARRIRTLGRGDVEVAGNMKFDVTAPAQALATGQDWRARFAHRPVLLAASTRDGEERLLLDAWQALSEGQAADGRRPLLAIVPRHPQRFDEVAAEIARRGLRVERRSQFDALAAPGAEQADVLLGDSMGEMFAYYGLADVALIGGSLLPFGGQNLIEACAAGVPVLVGEHTFNFAEAAAQAIEAGAALRVEDVQAAVRAGLELLADPARRARMSDDARRFAAAHRGATARTIALLEPWLPPARRSGARLSETPAPASASRAAR